ncbi:hypothetical protein GCM10011324_34880 [Allosediminivita pacifica]|uniref:Mannosylglycerate hydrolase MGH1-like glycoside hydrolase domain-containing protein n=2 Tax=Allosediminivita pacifica TaxID=1267769 RepID=A0A2T6AJ00_9RHOB|nr:hypothetical protein [Allosediminivita pacifica]PTX43799.1 hypothetical protein C8N44_12411 [Allosediminivita pacifica]GGB21902.1 hypothetical protein GCM10011324_34880 [Allosediminivita pacifica]
MTDDALDADARAILTGNDKGGYTIPTEGLYPFQWNWDSAFAAWGFSTFDADRAWTELDTLFSAQWDTGMVPHIIFHKEDDGYFPGPDVWGTGTTPASSGISQPPVTAILARLIHERTGDTERLRALYPHMLAFHRWWRDWRCVNGVACVTHPWESGRDNCPDWDPGMANVDTSGVGDYQRRDTGHVDASMRPGKEDYDRYLAIVYYGREHGWDQAKILHEGPFLMADPAIQFILIRANRDLAAIAELLGEDPSEPRAMADEIEAALPEIWNEELQAYCARDMKTGEFAKAISSGAALGLLAGVENAAMEQKLGAMWDRVTYGIPSNDPAADSFDPRRYWRGPTWPVVNALIAVGLSSAGRTTEEARLRRETAELIRNGGFFEYFDPIDGTACGGDRFTWTAAIWLAWASPNAGEA